jgi:phage repressor protein C with HTH and peptisase S24 domain
MQTHQLLALIEARLDELGMSVPDLLERAFGNRTSSAIADLKRGRSPSFKKVEAICDALGLDVEIGPPRSNGSVYSVDMNKYAEVARYDVRASAGDGYLNLEAAPVDHLAFSLGWLHQNNIVPECCVLISVSGESMQPSISDRDLVMIDRRRTQITSGKVYVYNDPDDGTRVKRLELVPGTAIIVRSDNPDQKRFPPEFHTGKSMNAIAQSVLGEVVWSGHTWR